MATQLDLEKEMLAYRQKQMEQEAAAANAEQAYAGSYGPPMPSPVPVPSSNPDAGSSLWGDLGKTIQSMSSKKGEVGYGMPVDKFMMTMGGLASSLAPNNWAGRLGANMQAQGEQQWKQRMLEESPERRLATAKADQMLKMAAQPTYGPAANVDQAINSMVLPNPTQGPTVKAAERLNGGGFTATPYMDNINKTLANLGVSTPAGMASAEAQYKQQSMTPGESAREQLSLQQLALGNQLAQGLMPGQIRQQNATADLTGVNAEVAALTSPTQVAQSEATLGLTNDQRELLGNKNKYYQLENIINPLKITSMNNAVQYSNQNMNERTRVSSMVLKASESVDNQIKSTNEQLNKILQNTMPKEQYKHYYQAGKTNIDSGLGHLANSIQGIGNMSREDLKAVQSTSLNAINTGLQNIVSGINHPNTSLQNKTKMTMDLIDQLDRVRSVDKGLANEYEQMLFGDGGTIAGKTERAPVWKFWADDKSFDPKAVWKAYRESGRGAGGTK